MLRHSGHLFFWLGRFGGRTGPNGLIGSIDEFDRVLRRLSQPRDFLLLSPHQRIKLRNLFRILALLMFAKKKEVRVVLRTPAMEEKLVLLENRIAQLRRLLDLRAMVNNDASVALLIADGLNHLRVNAQLIIARLQPLDLKSILRRGCRTVRFIRKPGRPTQLRLQNDSFRIVIPLLAFEDLHAVGAFAQRAILQNSKSPGVGRPSQSAADGLGSETVSVGRQMNAIVCKWRYRSAKRSALECLKQRNEASLVRERNGLDRFSVERQLFVVLCRVRKRRR